MQEFFQLVAELIGLHGADTVEHWLVAGQIGIGPEHSRQVVIFQPVQLQCEKHKGSGEVGDLFLAIGHELGAISVGGHLVVAQASVGHDTPGNGADFFVAQYAVQKAVGVQIAQLAFVIVRKTAAGFFEPVQITSQFGRVFARIKITQIPFGQIAQGSRCAGFGHIEVHGDDKTSHACLFAAGLWLGTGPSACVQGVDALLRSKITKLRLGPLERLRPGSRPTPPSRAGANIVLC